MNFRLSKDLFRFSYRRAKGGRGGGERKRGGAESKSRRSYSADISLQCPHASRIAPRQCRSELVSIISPDVSNLNLDGCSLLHNLVTRIEILPRKKYLTFSLSHSLFANVTRIEMENITKIASAYRVAAVISITRATMF